MILTPNCGSGWNVIANPRLHATTQRVVVEAFAEERLYLRPLPLAPFRSVLRLDVGYPERAW